MNYQRLVLLAALASLCTLYPVGALAKISVTNMAKGETFRYPLVLVEGTYDGKRLIVETKPSDLETSITSFGQRFRFLVDLKPGVNSLQISDSDSSIDLKLNYAPPTSTKYRLKAWYVVCKGEDPLDPQFNVYTTPLYKEKISTQIKFMQSWSAEDMKRGGYGRKTIYPIFDENGDVDVGLITLPMTRDEVVQSKRGIYDPASSNLPEEYKKPYIKNLVFTSVRAAAQGGGNVCVVGTKTLMKIGPYRVGDIMDMLNYPAAVDHLQWRAYVGVTLHEMGHMHHSAWHPGGRNNIVQSAYSNISRYFTLTDGSKDPKPHNDEDLSSWGVHQPLMNWNRFFMTPDAHEYKDAKVEVKFENGQIVASSPHNLAVFYYYVPGGNPTLYKILAGKPVKRFNMSVEQALKELSSEWFNVMVVDVEGNMSYSTYGR